MATETAIKPEVPPSGTGCVECMENSGWWFHLRRCAECGHVGCCDSSVEQHARRHAEETGHPVIQSFEPGEDWFWDYETADYAEGPRLAAPDSHPENQPAPGPDGAVPPDWREKLH
ncbi:UBP-type zinc finger domain-containing protein [Herbiconiux sp. CPCC 205763]|uniref:UBP-type zinc finger domain-containing protein n=1 Tax=Herbiconiux aconitum TaxID=2970913 RepID=A0ABT2GU08_9MICO|nr:UBP-type zinc finger domain-containing protein [Herbiconiux aconitum]MCS5719694.1 UBP-type zinc finger domain-containing protein [Herbiconiux aconitum]